LPLFYNVLLGGVSSKALSLASDIDDSKSGSRRMRLPVLALETMSIAREDGGVRLDIESELDGERLHPDQGIRATFLFRYGRMPREYWRDFTLEKIIRRERALVRGRRLIFLLYVLLPASLFVLISFFVTFDVMTGANDYDKVTKKEEGDK